MATLSSEFGTENSSNPAQFQAFGNTLFSQSNSDQQQQQLALRNAQLQLRNQQLLFQKQSILANDLDQTSNKSNNSSTSPIPNRFSPDNLSHNGSFSHASPEKPGASQSPPSPADSGVVADSKLDGGNGNHNGSPVVEHSTKLDDGFEFVSTIRSPGRRVSFGGTSSVPSGLQNNMLSFQTDESRPVVNSLGLSTSNSNFVSDLTFGINSNEEADNNNIAKSQDLAAIWQNPALTVTSQESPSLPAPSVDEIMIQALQAQQLNSWSNAMAANTSGAITNPPPGLYNNAMLQKQIQQHQNTAAQIQAIQHQLAVRQSQSSVMTPPSLNRSTSHQPGYMGALGNLNQAKINGLLPSSKPTSYSSWSSGQASLSSAWPGSNGRSASLFNSLQHGAGSNRLINASTALRKQSLTSQITQPPRLNRSISTPAKYSSYMNGPGLTTSLEDNPFFKTPDAPSQNGLLPLDNNDTMGLSSIESQLYDIMRSTDAQSLNGHNLPRPTGKWTDMNSDVLFEESSAFNQVAPNLSGNFSPFLGNFNRDRFSRKVFVGGLPPDIDEEEIQASFRQFGPLVVDWPHKAESKSYFPPKGYAFLLFQDEMSVQNLISCCLKDGDKLYLRVSSPTIREKPVQIRPWNLADSDFVLDGSQPLDPRKTIFVGGVPRPLRAVELAMIMDRLYGGVCYAGIDVDPELKYPKGAGRVAFSNQQSYIAAISARFVQLQHGDIDKRVEVKPYVLDDQHCDECQGSRCGGKFAPFFCANVTCLQYYCEHCWATIHARPGREFHKPLVKEGADRSPRSMPCRW